MRQLLLCFLLLHLVAPTVRAQEQCQFGSEDAGDNFAKALNEQRSCQAAKVLMDKCAWGSSADTGFAPIVIQKCEKSFYLKLTPAGQTRYGEEMQLCAYEYARQQGTMYMSAAALCQVDVAASYAAHPEQANLPSPRASFDCDRASTPIEKAICSDIRLGHADIVLSRVYKSTLKGLKGDEQKKLIDSQRAWLTDLPARCGLNTKTEVKLQKLCLRNEIEKRFTALDGCGEDINECTDSKDDNDSTEGMPTAAGERASFDCEDPQTGLEIVICADASLGQDDIELAGVYKGSLAAAVDKRQQYVESERQWLRFVNQNCPLGIVGGIPSVFARACVRSAFEVRIAQLRECPQKPAPDQIHCLNDFQIMAK